MWDLAVLAVVLLLSLPVFAYSAYTTVLLASSLLYRPPPRKALSGILPSVSVLLAVYNESGAVDETLSALEAVDYPAERLQVVVADDSTDETIQIVERHVMLLNSRGVEAAVSRRGSRQGYKAGALNVAAHILKGEYVLLIDADSRVATGALRRAVETLEATEHSFVSFRVGHYNREDSIVTRSFALFQDTLDSMQKMGSLRIHAPFSLQGGFVLARRSALEEVGFWREGVLAEDADMSCRLYSGGHSGVYLSDAELLSEDPGSLRVWKRQVARVAHGWAQCLRVDFRMIAGSKRIGPLGKAALILTMLSPFAALSWIAVTLVTAYSLALGVVGPTGSVYGSPAYVGALALPAVVFYLAGLRALRFRGMLTARNLVLLPYLSYLLSGTFAISGLSFALGLAGRPGYFFRTPKKGGSGMSIPDAQAGEGRGVMLFELGVSVLALAALGPVLLLGQYFLGLALLAFALVTLKSMELTRFFRKAEEGQARFG